MEEVQKNKNLLSLPQVLSEVLKETGNEDFSPEKLAKIILKDPSLTGRILKISNSSFYHRISEITTVHQAISVLGATTVKCLALSSSIFHPEKVAAESGVDPKEFFTYLLSTAAAAEKIAQTVDFKAPEEAFIAGLLHDLGTMYFLHHHGKEYRKIVEKKISANSLTEAEKQIFGVDHTEVGIFIANTLGLPEYVALGMSGHHNLQASKNDNTIGSIVKLAVLLSSDKFTGFETPLEDRLIAIKSVSNHLGLSKEQIDEVSFSLLPKTIEVAEYLGVDIGDIEEMLIGANQEIWKAYLVIENLFRERQELSRSLLEQERAKGAIESKNIAMATLSHYLNNAIMAIYGRSQLMRMFLDKGNTEKLIEMLPSHLEILDSSTKKIVAVLEEMKDISPIDQKKFYDLSQALNIDDKIEARMSTMTKENRWDGKIEIYEEV